MDALRTSGFRWTMSLVLDRLGIPVLRYWPEKRISPEVLEKQLSAVFRAWGMDQEHIEITTKHVMYADLHGIESHGCSMLLHYHRQLRASSITMTPDIKIVVETGTTAVIDGGGGLGHVPADVAIKLAMEKCRETGVGVVVVRHSGHYGAAGAYAAIASQSGLIGMAMTNVQTPALVPTHGLEAVLGTNPIAFSAPAGSNPPFLLDMATSIVPVGKLVTAKRRGQRIPAGWALDQAGKTVRNPDKAIAQRRVTPLGQTHELGSHKGYGLAAMVEVLCSVLSANDEVEGVGHFFLVLDPAKFGEPAAFKSGLDEMMGTLRATKPEQAGQPVQVAGDPEYHAAENNLQHGIPLTQSVIEDIRWVCRDSDVPFLLDSRHEDMK